MQRRYSKAKMDSRKFLDEVKPRKKKAQAVRKSLYVSEAEWNKFLKNCEDTSASLVLEHFIRIFNDGMSKPDDREL